MEIKVGDRVKIKTWKEMEKENGVDFEGDIDPSPGTIAFVKEMKSLCGKVLTVGEFDDNGYFFTCPGRPWKFANWMISTITTPPPL